MNLKTLSAVRIGPYQRPKLSDPAHEGARLQPGRDGRVRCSAWLNSIRFADRGVIGLIQFVS